MLRNQIAAVAALAVMTTGTMLIPAQAHAAGWFGHNNGLQNTKNNWRNVTIGSAALAITGLLTHNNTLGLVGVAGTAIGATQYENARHEQSVQQNGCGYNHYGRYDGGRYDNNYGDHYDGRGW